jgi:hypothetical protein
VIVYPDKDGLLRRQISNVSLELLYYTGSLLEIEGVEEARLYCYLLGEPGKEYGVDFSREQIKSFARLGLRMTCTWGQLEAEDLGNL